MGIIDESCFVTEGESLGFFGHISYIFAIEAVQFEDKRDSTVIDIQQT